MSITKEDKEYITNFELWQQVRAALKGKYAIIEDLVSSLPGPQYRDYTTVNCNTPEQQLHAQRCADLNNKRVRSYWSRGRFFNATGRTFESLGGMIWSKDPEKNIPARLEYLEDNADGAGCGLTEMAQTITDELIAIGRYGVLVDMPESPVDINGNMRSLTMAEMNSAEFSPVFIQYKAEQIIFVRANGKSKSVDEIRLVEFEEQRKEGSEFEWETIKYIRRLVLIDGVYHNQRYKVNEKYGDIVSDIIPRANGSVLTEIPFQFFGSDTNTYHFSKVPLYDLANMNLGHFVLDCDNRDNLHFHGQGMTNVFSSMDADTFAEANPNGLDSGAKGVNQFEQGDKVELLQLEATGAIPAEMTRDQERMVSLGAQLITDTNTNETLGAKRIDSNASTSTLKRIARNTSRGMKNLLMLAGEFLGINEDAYYDVNTDFVTDELSPELLNVHMALVQGGSLPQSTLNESARKAGLTNKSDEDIKQELEDQNLLTGSSEELATLQAELDAAREELETLRAPE